MTVTRVETAPRLHAGAEAVLSIGELAMQTGVSVGTLRMWETRYAFPQPHRLASGHRRYRRADVQKVRDVLRRRERGIRLDAAIDQIDDSRDDAGALAPRAALPPTTRHRIDAHSPSRDAAGAASPGREVDAGEESVFAMLRRRHGTLRPQRLRKPVLISLSRAMEDDFCSSPQAAMTMFGAFQRRRHYEGSRPRWEDLTRTCQTAYVFADFAETDDPATVDGPVRIALPSGSPFLREWAVVCVGDTRSMALSAWELPGQDDTPDEERRFEAVWTTDAAVVRDVAVACARVAARYGVTDADEVAERLRNGHAATAATEAAADGDAAEPVAASDRAGDTHRQLTSLLNRLVPYLDRAAPAVAVDRLGPIA